MKFTRLCCLAVWCLLAVLLLAGASARADTRIGEVAVGANPQAVAVNTVTNKIYVANSGSNTVTVIDGATNATTTVNVGTFPIALAVNETTNKIYVANQQSGNVTVIDGSDNSTATVTAGASPTAVAVNQMTNMVYVANNDGDPSGSSGSVSVIDGATNVATSIQVGPHPVAVAANPVTNTIYVVGNGNPSFGSGFVLAINGADNTVKDFYLGASGGFGSGPSAVIVNPSTNVSYAIVRGRGFQIDGVSNQATRSVANATGAAVAVNSVSNKAYFAGQTYSNFGDVADAVTVLDGATSTVATVLSPKTPKAVSVNLASGKIYVANFGSNTVTVIDGISNATASLGAGTNPIAVAINPVTNRIYVANQGSANVTVIDGSTDLTPAAAFVPVGTNPSAAVVNPITNKTYVTNLGSDDLTVFDGGSGTTATVVVGSLPSAVAVNTATNEIYVANFGSGTVSVIKGADNTTTTVPAGTNPQAVAVNPVTNRIYVANRGSANLTVIDGVTKGTMTVAVGTQPSAVTVNPATNKIYVANSGSGNVTEIDGATNATAMIAVGSQPLALAVNPVTNTIYVANSGSGDVTVIYGADRTTATVPAGTNPIAVAINPATNRIYVANQLSANVTVIDGTNNGAATVSVGNQPGAVAAHTGSNQIYVTNRASGTVSIIDGATNATTMKNVGLSPNAVAVNPTTDQICVVNRGSDNVALFHGATNTAIAFQGGTVSRSLAVNPVTNKIYVANELGNNLTVIDGATGITSTVASSVRPGAIAVNALSNKIYVVNSNDTVLVIDGVTNLTKTVNTRSNPVALALNPLTNEIYVANAGSSNVTVIDGMSNATSTVDVGSNPIAIAVNAVTNKIYVVNQGGDNVTVIDGTTKAAVTVAVGSFPEAVVVNERTNKIYVANQMSSNITVIDGATNASTTVSVGTLPTNYQDGLLTVAVNPLAVNPLTNKIFVAVLEGITVIDCDTNAVSHLSVAQGARVIAVDPVTNRYYATNIDSNNLTVIDGATGLAITSASLTHPERVVISPVTNKAYVANLGEFIDDGLSTTIVLPSSVTVLDPSPQQPGFLQTTIQPLANNSTVSATPTFNFTATSTYTPTAPLVQQIYYQLDAITGPWLKASPMGGAASGVSPPLIGGMHVVYAFATDGQEAAAGSPVPGQVSAYAFFYVPPQVGAFSFASARTIVREGDGVATVKVRRNFTDPAIVQYQTAGDTAVAGSDFTQTQGTLIFGQDELEKEIVVPILNDDAGEPVESFTIRLSNPSGASVLGTPSVMQVVILDDDTLDDAVSRPLFTLPDPAPASRGSIQVTLAPPEALGQWRLFGELDWRNSGAIATGLTSGNYAVQFRPRTGYDAPPLLAVPVAEGESALAAGTYVATAGAPPAGALRVSFQPASAGGWRLQGDTAYRQSGDEIESLAAGNYILEFKPVAGRVTPSKRVAVIEPDQLTAITSTYLIGDAPAGLRPQLVDDSVARTVPPYSFTGQIQTDNGFGSGFVPTSRVVVTAAHVVFDDSALSFVEGIRWSFQHERGVFEAPPQIPRGMYTFTGYAGQRAADNSPGISSTPSQQLDVAALYFLEPAARGGASGFLASDSTANSWLTGPLDKMIVGYPVEGVTSDEVGRLHATPSVQSAFAFVTGRLFRTTALTSFPGNSGGPVCVRFTDGQFYPAAIYLGGTAETVVRAIDSQVVELINRGEVSGNGGANNVSPGITRVSSGLSGTTLSALASVKVTLAPADAVRAGATWRIGAESVNRKSGEVKDGLVPRGYTINFAAVPGFDTPASASVSAISGNVTPVTGRYVPNVPPQITSALADSATAGLAYRYQITALRDPTIFTADGLPPGLTIGRSTGLISGAPMVAATPMAPVISDVTLHVTNAAGTTSATLRLTIRAPGRLSVAVSGGGSVPKTYQQPTLQKIGSVITITAKPAANSFFQNWSDADTGQVLATTPAYKFTMPVALNLTASFIPNRFPAAQGDYAGLFRSTDGALAGAGMIRLTLMATRAFTATINVSGQAVTVRQSFDIQGNYGGTITLPNKRLLQLTLTLSESGTLTGLLYDLNQGVLIFLRPTRGAYGAKNPATEFAGNYTVVIPAAPGDPSLPEGDGYGTLSITKTGAVTFVGFLGDGAAVSASAALGAGGAWPLFIVPPVSKGAAPGSKGLVLGTITPTRTTATPATVDGFQGTLDWLRPADAADALYPDGFTTQLRFSAARYAPPAASAGAATMTFSGTGLDPAIVESLTINAAGNAQGVAMDGFTLKFVKGTGLFSGTFVEPNVTKPRLFKGAVFQKDRTGGGFFLGDGGRTGSAELAPQ